MLGWGNMRQVLSTMVRLLVLFESRIFEVEPALVAMFHPLATVDTAFWILGMFLSLMTTEGASVLELFGTKGTIIREILGVFHRLVFHFTNAVTEVFSRSALQLLRSYIPINSGFRFLS